MATEKFANNAVTTLNGSILSSDLTLVVTDASKFPALPQFRLKIESEYLLVTGVAGATFTVSRGQEGSTAAGHASGSQVVNILTAASADLFVQTDDTRLADDRTASGLRTATTVVVTSSATAPSAGQVLTASSTTAAAWAAPASGLSGQSASDTVLSTDASTSILAQSLLSYGLGVSKTYSCTLGFRCIIWETATKANSGSMDSELDLYVTTDGSGNVTVALQTTPTVNKSRLGSVLNPASMTVAPSSNGFTISATRPAGVACTARAKWWINSFEDIT